MNRLDPQRYFESIDTDTERLLAMAERGLDAAVPCCPGWTVADVVSHVAMVYEHKVRVMADGAWPSPWPPADYSDREPIEFLVDAKAHLFAEFADHLLTDEATTFSADDQTIAFWVRRMALEIAIHRLDGELAHKEPTAIADDIALDGVDEVLRVMLAGPWWESRITTAYPINGVVAVESGQRRWMCVLRDRSITIGEDAGARAAATITGQPEALFRWLWGGAGGDAVDILGDPEVATQFRGRLAECTG